MRTIEVTEGEDFELEVSEAYRLRKAIGVLKEKLRPRFRILKEDSGVFRLQNIIGTIHIGGGVNVYVSPKIGVDWRWDSAVANLLTGRERIEVTGERRAGLAKGRDDLLDSLATIFLIRLERAFRQEGPIMLMRRNSTELSHLHGTLNASKWAVSASWRPHIYPVSKTEFAHDNQFTQVLVWVADMLAKATSSTRVRNRLHILSRDLAPGVVKGAVRRPVCSSQQLPQQWNAYKPAWALAVSILTKASLLGAVGNRLGVSFAIEAWPLLETLLDRTLRDIVAVGKEKGRKLEYRVKGRVELLDNGPFQQETFEPEPDGRLFENGEVVASFEAKYANVQKEKLPREHIYQALSTSAACSSPLAVLVYPGSFEERKWRVRGFNEQPQTLMAIGLELFRWRSTHDANLRAEALLQKLDELRLSSKGNRSSQDL